MVITKQELMRATPQSQATQRANEAARQKYTSTVNTQQQQISQGITRAQAEIALWQGYIQKYKGQQSMHQFQKRIAKAQGELDYYTEAQKVSEGNKVLASDITPEAAQGYAIRTPAYVKERRSLSAEKSRLSAKRKEVPIIETTTITDLPAQEVGVERYYEERIVETPSKLKQLGIITGFRKPDTQIYSVEKYPTMEIIKPATQEEKKYYTEQKAIISEENQKKTSTSKPYAEFMSPAFKTGVKLSYSSGTTPIAGILNVAGYASGEAMKKRIYDKQAGKFLGMSDRTSVKLAQAVPQLAYFNPAIIGSHAFMLVEQRITGEGKSIEQAKEREKYYEEIGIKSPTLRKNLAYLPTDLQIAGGFMAMQSALSSRPIITKGKTTRTTFLIQEKVNVAPIGAESKFKIITKTSRDITTENRGLIVMGDRFSTITKVRYDVLQPVKNIVFKDNQAYGLVTQQRVGAKMSKLYELKGTVTPLSREQIIQLPKEQQYLFKNIRGSVAKDTQFGIGEVQLRELGKIRKVGTKYLVTPKVENGKTLFTSAIGGKTSPVSSIGIKSKDFSIGIKMEGQDRFLFSEVSGKRIIEGMPRAGGKLYNLDVLSDVKQTEKLSPFSTKILEYKGSINYGGITVSKAEETGIKFMKPSPIIKTPFSTTFAPVKVIQITEPITKPISPIVISKSEQVLTTSLISVGTKLALPSKQIQVITPLVKESSLFGLAGLIKVSGKVKQDSILKPMQDDLLIPQEKVIEIVEPIEILKSGQGSQLKPVQALDFQQIQIPVYATKAKVQPKLFNVPELPEIKTTNKKEEKKTIDSLLSNRKAYQLFVKKGGKWSALGKPMLKSKAIKIGEDITLKTLAASFKVSPTKKMITTMELEKPYKPSSSEFRTYKILKGRRVPLTDEWIQKRTRRLGRKGETKELQVFKRQKMKGGKSFRLF